MIVSIDIGTSYSSISMLDPDGKAQPIDIGTGVSMFGSKYSLPSAVFAEDDGQVLLGQDALNNRMRDPQRFRDEFKRNLGETIPIMLGSKSFLPEELYTEFFRHMKDRAEKVSGEQIELAYLTHPAAYGTSKKNKILSAAKAAGLYDVELVDEPTAAAMSYCAAGYIKDGQNLLIYDFGGGTFDTAMIRYENGSFTLLTAPRGLERCGGIDIDRLIFRDMLSKVDPAMLSMLQANNLHYMRFVSQLSELAVKCKHQLSSPEAGSFSGYIQVGFDMIPYMLTLEQYNQMIAGMVGQTIQTCRQMLTDAKMKVEDLSAVLLVGGTSRVRLVRELVEQMAGKVPVYCAADLELAVSQGALNYRNYKKPEPTPVPDPVPIPEPEQLERRATEIEIVLRNVLDKYPEVDPEERHEISRQASYMELRGLPKDDVVLLWNDQLGFCVTQRGIYKEKSLGEFGQFVPWDTFVNCEIIRIHYDSHPIKFRLPNSNQRFEIRTKFDSVAFLRDLQKELQKLKETKLVEKEDKSYPVADEADFEDVKLNEAHDSKSEESVREAHFQFLRGRQFAREGKWGDAFLCFLRAAQMGDSEAMYSLATCYKQGLGTEKDSKMEGIWSLRATEARIASKNVHENTDPNVVEADKKNGSPTKDRQAAKKETDSYRDNDPKQLDERALQFGREGHWRAAFEAFQKAANMNFAPAQYHLAGCYERGTGTVVDWNNAKIWYHRAAAQGYTAAQDKLRIIERSKQQNAISNDKNDSKQSPNYLNIQGLKYSREGRLYDAFECYYSAAELGCADAQYNLATCFEEGKGTNADIHKAKSWYQKAANQGHAAAKNKLEMLERNNRPKINVDVIISKENDPKYLDERGLQCGREGHWRAAFEAFQKAANMNYAPAQYHLAGCYERGTGTVVDWSNAKIWYHRAAAQGHNAAKDKLKQLERSNDSSTPDQIVRQLLKKWTKVRNATFKCWNAESGQNKNTVPWLDSLKNRLHVPAFESVLIAEDMTLFGSGKSGMIITEKGIHEGQAPFVPRFISWSQFAQKELEWDKDGDAVWRDGRMIYGSSRLPKDFWIRLHTEIKKLY